MRLLHVESMKLHTFYGDGIPPYAILSHTWLKDYEEVTFTQVQNPEACRHLAGYRKIELLLNQAADEGYEYAWIDTCCIDKTSSAELSEAINSMFAWYQRSQVCYAYLTDVDKTKNDNFMESRWWTRAWTLQELLASQDVIFYDNEWNRIGSKFELAAVISKKTGIDKETLREPEQMYLRSVAQRMSWASTRQATRIEDTAYSLLGIFDINMPLLYGEGKNAFVRLQQEILRNSSDQSLFAWGFSRERIQDFEFTGQKHLDAFYAMFCDSPKGFKNSGQIISHDRYGTGTQISVSNGTLHLDVPLIPLPVDSSLLSALHGLCIGLLPCGLEDKPHLMMGILLRRWMRPDGYRRVSPRLGVSTFVVHCKDATDSPQQQILQKILINYSPSESRLTLSQNQPSYFTRSIVLRSSEESRVCKFGGFLSWYQFESVEPPEWQPVWDKDTLSLHFREPKETGVRCVVLGFRGVLSRDLLCVYVKVTVALSFLKDEVQIFSIPSLEVRENTLRQVLEDATNGRQGSSIVAGGGRGVSCDFVRASIGSRKVFNHIISRLDIFSVEKEDKEEDEVKELEKKRKKLQKQEKERAAGQEWQVEEEIPDEEVVEAQQMFQPLQAPQKQWRPIVVRLFLTCSLWTMIILIYKQFRNKLATYWA